MDTARTRPGNSLPKSPPRHRLGDRLLLHAPVLSVGQIAARMIRIRLDTAGLAIPGWLPGQQVRVAVGDAPAPKDWIFGQMRTYSIWEYTPDRLDLAVLDHGDGPGVEWARRARPGQHVAFTRPQGTLVAQPSGSHLLIGEETAAVAFGAILRALPRHRLPGRRGTHHPGAPQPSHARPRLAQTRHHHQAVLDSRQERNGINHGENTEACLDDRPRPRSGGPCGFAAGSAEGREPGRGIGPGTGEVPYRAEEQDHVGPGSGERRLSQGQRERHRPCGRHGQWHRHGGQRPSRRRTPGATRTCARLTSSTAATTPTSPSPRTASGLTWNQMGAASMQTTLTIQAAFTRR
jgi:NADPH-dependent ferric siderophore reductase